MKGNQPRYIIAVITVFSLAVTWADAFLNPAYGSKIAVKILFFLLLPMLYYLRFRHEAKELLRFRKETLLQSLGIGLGIYGVILLGYFLTRGSIDYSNVTVALQEKHGVTRKNFLAVSLYISFFNSFLEEFFFRGLGFITLKRFIGQTRACMFSSALFAVYHIGMLFELFAWWLLPLLLAGLFAGGCIFCWLNVRSESIYPSWASHMFANFSINTVGYLLFGML